MKIDFREIDKDGKGLESFARDLLRNLGFAVDWSGEGTDGGRDITAVEMLPSHILPLQRRWLVQCKHNAHSGDAVGKYDLDSVTDKCAEHKADGYLLICTTRPTSAVVNMFNGINANESTRLHAAYWDATILQNLLARTDMAQIVRRHFPKSWRSLVNKDMAQALMTDMLEKGVPAQDAEAFVNRYRLDVLKAQQMKTPIKASVIYPYDDKNHDHIAKAIELFTTGAEFTALATVLTELQTSELTAFYQTFHAVEDVRTRALVDFMAGLPSLPLPLRKTSVWYLATEFRATWAELIDMLETLEDAELTQDVVELKVEMDLELYSWFEGYEVNLGDNEPHISFLDLSVGIFRVTFAEGKALVTGGCGAEFSRSYTKPGMDGRVEYVEVDYSFQGAIRADGAFALIDVKGEHVVVYDTVYPQGAGEDSP